MHCPHPDACDAVFGLPFTTPPCALGACMQDGELTQLVLLPPGTPLRAGHGALLTRLGEALAAYAGDPHHRFSLPLRPAGTPFRQRVWQALGRIPPGATRTYGELARDLGSSARAIGQAVGDNPLPILIPCHRVVAAHGGLGGFNHCQSGFSLALKRGLLAHEAGR